MHSPLLHRLQNRPTRPILLSLIVFAMAILTVLGAVILWTGHVPVLAQGAENHLSVIPAQGDGSVEATHTLGTARLQQEYSTQGQSETPPTQTESAGDGSTTRNICRPNSLFRDGHDNSMYTVEIFAGSGTSPFDFQTTLDEGDGPAVFTLTIDPEVPRKESLSIGTEANCEGNYVETMIQPSYTIDGGESGLSEDTLEYAIDDDNIVEPDGYIDIQLGGTITFGRNRSAKVWILDNDPVDPIIGLAVRDFTLTPSNETLAVSWTEPTSSPTYYWMQSKAPFNGRYWTVPFRRIGGSEESFTLNGLTNGREYTVRMIACNNSGCGAWSRELDGTPASLTTPASTDAQPFYTDIQPRCFYGQR